MADSVIEQNKKLLEKRVPIQEERTPEMFELATPPGIETEPVKFKRKATKNADLLRRHPDNAKFTKDAIAQTVILLPERVAAFWSCNCLEAETLVDMSNAQVSEELKSDRLAPKPQTETMEY